MNDDYSKFTDYRQREFLLDYIEKSEAEFSEQTKIPEMKTKQQIKEESEMYLKTEQAKRENEDIERIENYLCKGKTYFTDGLSQKTIDHFLKLGFDIHRRKEAIGFGLQFSFDGTGKFFDDGPEYYARKDREEEAERKKPWYKKLFEEKPVFKMRY